ncbi:MAG: T9SS type A sorting domain-containing protein, partial [Calditrichaeota bacterium]|nr:T9SS type A sorting domain-containing protein [Calditrichota bacterium]
DRANTRVPPSLDSGSSSRPASFALYPVSPNPFNPDTMVRFSLAEDGPASLVLYDIQGRKVLELFRGQLPAGERTLRLDAGPLASGVYILQLQSGEFHSARRISLVR